MTSRGRRMRAEVAAEARSFLRRRTAVFFTFLFPVLIVLIFGVLVRTRPTGGGIFAEPPGYYVPGYLAVVVLFTPLSRVGSTVARHREGNRFEKLATTPLRRWEWLLAHATVTAAVVGLAGGLLLGLTVGLTGATVALGPSAATLVPLVALAVAVFAGIGAVLGRITDSRDGVVAASNTLALPLLFLSETFVPPALVPAWFRPVVALSPLTHFARGVRAVTFDPGGVVPVAQLAVLTPLAVASLLVGAYAIPRTD